MENKELTCICCPMGCALNIEMENNEVVKVIGNTCKRGDTYARAEIVRPVRMVTTIVKVENGKLKIENQRHLTCTPGIVQDEIKPPGLGQSQCFTFNF